MFIVIMLYKTVINHSKKNRCEPLPTSDKDQIHAEEYEREALRKKCEIKTISQHDQELGLESPVRKEKMLFFKKKSKMNYEKAL